MRFEPSKLQSISIRGIKIYGAEETSFHLVKVLLFILLNNGEDDVRSKDYTEVHQSSHIIAHLMLVRTKFFREKTTPLC